MVLLWVTQCVRLSFEKDEDDQPGIKMSLIEVNLDFETEHYRQMVNILQSTDPRGNTPVHHTSQSVLSTCALLFPVFTKLDWSMLHRLLFETKNKEGKSVADGASLHNRRIYRAVSSKFFMKTMALLFVVLPALVVAYGLGVLLGFIGALVEHISKK